MVPRGARRSDQKAHPSRLEQARRFLPSWSCEFDSRHPLQNIAPSQLTFAVPKLFEHRDDKNNQAGHLSFMIISARCTEVPCQVALWARNQALLKLITPVVFQPRPQVITTCFARTRSPVS